MDYPAEFIPPWLTSRPLPGYADPTPYARSEGPPRRGGKQLHRLREVDPLLRTAVCGVCGPINVTPRVTIGWKCRGYRSALGPTPLQPDRDPLAYWQLIENWVCEGCGFTSDDRRLFQVHHRDHDRAHNERSNLAVLCPTCHRRVHLAEYDQRRRERVDPPISG